MTKLQWNHPQWGPQIGLVRVTAFIRLVAYISQRVQITLLQLGI